MPLPAKIRPRLSTLAGLLWPTVQTLALAVAWALTATLGVAAGLGLPVALTHLSYGVDVPPETEERLVELFDWLTLMPPAILGLWWWRGRGPLRAPLFLGGASGLMFVLMGYGMADRHIFQGPYNYGVELYYAADQIASFAPQITGPAYLDTKVSPGMRQHVAANEPSTGPKVISLHQVDGQAWGAAALDPEAGCLLVLVDVSSGLRKAAQLRYDKGAADQPCTAKQITRTVVTNPERGAWGCRLRNAGRIPGC